MIPRVPWNVPDRLRLFEWGADRLGALLVLAAWAGMLPCTAISSRADPITLHTATGRIPATVEVVVSDVLIRARVAGSSPVAWPFGTQDGADMITQALARGPMGWEPA